MPFTESDHERLITLLSDLKTRVLRPGQAPYQGMQELGQFIEEVHTALGQCLGFDYERVHISGWHTEMRKHGYNCHPATYGALDLIYGYRNISSHPNEEKHQITSAQVSRRLNDVMDDVPRLASHVCNHAFVDELFAVQKCSLHQHRAETLGAAIIQTGAVNDYLKIVLEYALPFVPERNRGFLKAPEDKQLKPLITTLGSLCSTNDNDVLKGLATHLIEQAPTLNIEPIHRWLIQYGTPLAPGSTPARLRVIRLVLDRDPRSSGAFLIRYATILEPVIPGLVEHLPEFPIPVTDLADLYVQIVKLLNSVKAAIDRAIGDAVSNSDIRNWQEFVFEVEVPADLAGLDFESASGARPGRNLVSHFRCITVRPYLDPDALHPLRGIDRPLFHPRFNRNSVAVWGTNNPKQLYQAAQSRDCLFTGPSAWRTCPDVPPLVEAFEGFPGAIVCSADDDITGLGPLYEDEEQRNWPELLDRVTSLRQNGASIKVLWNDPSYDTILAESV